jgi:hypothetical protein
MIQFITTPNSIFFYTYYNIVRKLFRLTTIFCSLGGLKDHVVKVTYDHYIVPLKKHVYFSLDETS